MGGEKDLQTLPTSQLPYLPNLRTYIISSTEPGRKPHLLTRKLPLTRLAHHRLAIGT